MANDAGLWIDADWDGTPRNPVLNSVFSYLFVHNTITGILVSFMMRLACQNICLSPAMNNGMMPMSGFLSHARTLRRMLARLALISADTQMCSMPSLPQMRAWLRRARSVTIPQS